MKETSSKIARLAARFLSGELKTLTRKQQLSVCASCVSQAEREQESVKAWGWERDGKVTGFAWPTREPGFENYGEVLIRVLITRADKRTQARKRK